jgi:hypothetical protein
MISWRHVTQWLGPAPDTQGRAEFVKSTEIVTDYERGWSDGRKAMKETIDEHCGYTAALERQLAEARELIKLIATVKLWRDFYVDGPDMFVGLDRRATVDGLTPEHVRTAREWLKANGGPS